jgi:hypothetical protein
VVGDRGVLAMAASSNTGGDPLGFDERLHHAADEPTQGIDSVTCGSSDNPDENRGTTRMRMALGGG